MAEEEVKGLRERRKELEDRLQLLLIPKDPDDDKDIFIEIRGGAGGDEAAIFAGDLARMYMRYAETLGMRVELVSQSESDAGGFKEIVFAVKGNSPYRHFKHESGVHRVQRVPVTESQGRVHTSTATVAVLPQVE
jgi:peptide chain release factor 1